MKNKIYKFWSKLLDIIGDIKLYKFPMFVVYDPTFFEMTGEKISKAISVMEPGDIVLRGYNMYLDSHFIDGDYSHGSICVSKDSIVHAISPDVCSIHPIEFMECDRIAILRPKDKSKIANALTTANELIGTPYDFNFNSGDQQEVYCFELVAKCYPEMNIQRFPITKLFGLIKRDVFLSKSFLENENLELVFEYNPKTGKDFSI